MARAKEDSRQKKTMQQKQIWDDHHDGVLFLNVIIEDSSEAVKAKVAKRLAMLPERVKNQAARRASALTNPGRIAWQVSQKMLKMIPEGMEEKGVTVKVEEVFREGPYIVFQMHVVRVDALTLTHHRMESFSDFVQWFMTSVGKEWQQTIEGDYLPKQILASLRRKIPKVLAQKLEEKKIVAETIVHADCEAQAKYFQLKVSEIREQEEARRRFLRRSLRRMSSSFGSRGSMTSLISDPSDELHIATQ